MGHLDRPWAFCSPRYRMLAVDMAFRSDDPVLGEVLAELLAPFAVPGTGAELYSVVDEGPAVAARYPVYRGDERVLAMPTRASVVRGLLWHLNQRAMYETLDRLVLHAGCAALDGVAVVVPGESGAGKSTLIARLVDGGLSYLSDEATVIDPGTGQVEPYPRSLTLLPGAWPLLPRLRPDPHPGLEGLDHEQWLVPPSRLGNGAPGAPARIGLVVLPELRPGHPTRCEVVPRATGLVGLYRALRNPAHHGAAGFHALVTVAREARCRRLVVGDDDPVPLVVGELQAAGDMGASFSANDSPLDH